MKTFLSGTGNIPIEEGFVYQHWLLVHTLLQIGLSYESIQTLTENEVMILLGIETALKEKENDDMERQQRMQSNNDQRYR